MPPDQLIRAVGRSAAAMTIVAVAAAAASDPGEAAVGNGFGRAFSGWLGNGVRARGMRTILILVTLIAVRVHGADGLKPGWTTETLADATSSCSDTLIEGAWANTQREQGVDPARPMTAEIREQL